MSPRYGYWAIQGRGNACRMALAFVGEEYQDDVYNFDAQAGATNHWPSNKVIFLFLAEILLSCSKMFCLFQFNLGLAFPNLPYYIDGSVKLTQSNAILRHVTRKAGLCGKSMDEAAEIDMLIDTSVDIHNALIKIIFNPDFENLKGKHIETIEAKFKEVSAYLGDKKFFLGDNITAADFAFYDAIKWHQALDAELIGKFANLIKWIESMDTHPKIKAYLASDKFFKFKTPPFAQFGGK